MRFLRAFQGATVLFFLLLVLPGSACGSSGDLAAATSGPRADLGEAMAREVIDPCELLGVDEIEAITDWGIPAGIRPMDSEADGQAVCSFTEARHVGGVQVQVHQGAGRELFEQRRAGLQDLGLGAAHDVDVAGADAAYHSPEHSVVGLLVGEHFAQVMTIGAETTDAQNLEMAGIVAGRLP